MEAGRFDAFSVKSARCKYLHVPAYCRVKPAGFRTFMHPVEPLKSGKRVDAVHTLSRPAASPTRGVGCVKFTHPQAFILHRPFPMAVGQLRRVVIFSHEIESWLDGVAPPGRPQPGRIRLLCCPLSALQNIKEHGAKSASTAQQYHY